MASALVFTMQLAAGWVVHAIRGTTPAFAHLAMIKLFCLTGGRSNDVMSRVIGWTNKPYEFSAPSGVLGEMTDGRRAAILDDLQRNGYHVFERTLPVASCDRLLAFAFRQRCTIRPMDGEAPGAAITTTYDRDHPRAVRYDFATQDLLEDPDVQELLADPTFAVVAQDYLGARPIIDVLAMWWHTGFSDRPDKEAAQFFHFDMDRPKWLKFFIYLTDVESRNGPHTFVAGSHRTGGIPAHLLAKGYARIEDGEVAACFAPGDIIEFPGRRGTIIAEDTRGLHKGKHVQAGDRLLLQVQMSNSLFGAGYDKARLPETGSRNLQDRANNYPSIYRAYR